MTNYRDMANAIRFLAADAVQKANSGHPGLPLGMADVATVLFTKHLKFYAKEPKWSNRDRFILSAGHGSTLLYSLLYLNGYEDWSIDDLKSFRQLNSKAAGHPEVEMSPGIEMTTGPLGQGLATAVGMALAERMHNSNYGDDLVDNRTWVLSGDGCLMEGISQEAITIAAHLGLGKLILLWDDNNITIDGNVSVASSEEQRKRFAAAGWRVLECDGHNYDDIDRALTEAKNSDGRPTMVACKTTIGMGSPNKAGTHNCHGSPLGDDEIAIMREHLGWSAPAFEVPDDILNSWREAGARGSVAFNDWQDKLNNNAKKQEFVNQVIEQNLPANWHDKLLQFKKELTEEAPKLATRSASGKVLEFLTKELPYLIGGSADLTGSVNTKTSVTDSLQKDNYRGRYIHYGVREFAMSAMMNGISLYGGLIPYSGGFLIFADYMRPAIRLSALMETTPVFVLTHDSIGVGEDGPTHQPVETLASLRAIPKLEIYRPCDVVEALEAWQLAIDNFANEHKRPSAIVLSRQAVPFCRTEYSTDNLTKKGAYEIFSNGLTRDGNEITFIATGTEVSLAVDVANKLKEDGIAARVISMPSMEKFKQEYNTKDKQNALLGTGKRVVIEAAIQMPWDFLLRDGDMFFGVNDFGVSAPGDVAYEYFGLTPNNIYQEVKKDLK